MRLRLRDLLLDALDQTTPRKRASTSASPAARRPSRTLKTTCGRTRRRFSARRRDMATRYPRRALNRTGQAPGQGGRPARLQPRYNPVDVTFLSAGTASTRRIRRSRPIHVDIRPQSKAGIDVCRGRQFRPVPPQMRPGARRRGSSRRSTRRPTFRSATRPCARRCSASDVSLGIAPDSPLRVHLLHDGRRATSPRRSLLAKGRGSGRRPGTRSTCSPCLEKFPGLRPDPEAFVESLEPLQPRLYSISSSHNATPGRVSLTVDHVRYADRRARSAAASPRLVAEPSRSAAAARRITRLCAARA